MKSDNVLLINICKEKLGFYEFVKPVGDILIKGDIRGFIRHYSCLTKKDIEKADKIIIGGTSIIDDEFIDQISRFKWIRDYNKPILGICGGMHIIGLVFGGKLKLGTEIGYFKEKFRNGFLGLKGDCEVYHLHSKYVDFNKLKEFEVFSGKVVSQAVKHRKKKIYGVLFHPEVRQKDLIRRFCEL